MHSIRLSTLLFTDGLFPVATIETDIQSRLTTVSGGKLDGQSWDDKSPLHDVVARHRAVLNRVIRAETGMRLAVNPMDNLLEAAAEAVAAEG